MKCSLYSVLTVSYSLSIAATPSSVEFEITTNSTGSRNGTVFSVMLGDAVNFSCVTVGVAPVTSRINRDDTIFDFFQFQSGVIHQAFRSKTVDVLDDGTWDCIVLKSNSVVARSQRFEIRVVGMYRRVVGLGHGRLVRVL